MDNRLYWIWLQQALGCGNPHSGTLISLFSRPENLYQASKRQLQDAGLKGVTLERLTEKSLDQAGHILTQMQKIGGWILTPDDAYYPNLLRGIYGLPLVLYGLGEMPNMDERPSFGIVGTRHPSTYGYRSATYIASGIAAGGMIVISGGAVGVDAAAHHAAMDASGCTVAVQACGLDISYPAENEPMRNRILSSGGAVITEYPLSTPPAKHHFPLRNRIISGLSLGVCVVEAPARSGALITARYAREQGRDIFAVPADITSYSSSGSNTLIQNGSQLAKNGVDILREYSDRFGSILNIKKAEAIPFPSNQVAAERHDRFMKNSQSKGKRSPVKANGLKEPVRPVAVKPPCPDGVSEDAAKIYAVMTDQPQPIDEISAKLEMATSRVMVALTELELFGCIHSCAGQQYQINTK